MRLSSSFRNPCMVRSNTPLTNDEIARVAPSIFAVEAHDSRSDRYRYIPTVDVLTALRAEGFEPFMACQTRVRNTDKIQHTKHMIRLRHASNIMDKEANEIILLNSHDGTSSYQMMGGCFRFVCANGLVLGEAAMDQKVRHSGRQDVIGEVIEGAYEVLDQFALIEDQRETMKQIQIRPELQHAFAEAALAYRYDPAEGPAPVTASQLLMPRRREDRTDDLWTTFNRVQENTIKGGLAGLNKQGRRTSTRAVSGIDQDVKLNRALWVLAQHIREAA
ncbi:MULTISPECIES: DUF932 domain-containing protein [unclassified Pseudomonas]|uniref:DUF932 domain-containing protein n=1 Tax=unclassified Pseudomonas TaxID=196821 RepID=UPI000C86CB88|nr:MULTISPECIES: DUF932 domain-containing protein [unclassified Pseudomonas]PMU22940.1 hypothetical protein C1X90_17860 [Pseudomonas sp. GP01-A9]PMU28522.1 hypothetical protein C1X88_17510 [Pseudomonas sp. GP01-A13]PMU38774.1 hypothetical protein C1X89_15065 [Pseudomonas sp. GP01-A8]PMU52392.1 hypothetical protein C1X85_18620 [Pseudomonas sp. GP01-A6]PMU54389.1 hypothetical protein C1X87_06125 [Pseudomonas sp. GP01-A14]